MKKFIIVLLVLAVCGVAIYFAYPEISKMINGGQNTTSSVTDSSAKVSSADSSDTAESSSAHRQAMFHPRAETPVIPINMQWKSQFPRTSILWIITR